MCFAFVDRLDTIMGYNNESSSIQMDMKSEFGISHTDNSVEKKITMALQNSLRKAAKEQRLVSGLLRSAQMLDTNAEDVLYCILPANTCDDVALHMHITLVEAFCWENEIPIIKVDNIEKLSKLIPSHQTGVEANSCFLVQYSEECSEDDDSVMAFYQDTYDCVPQPIVNV